MLGLGSAEFTVELEGLPPLAAGLLVLAGGVVAFGEVAVRACLLVGVAVFGSQPERCREFGARGGGLAGLVQGLGQGAERQGLAVLVAGLPVQRECLPEIADGLLVLALAQAHFAQVLKLGGHAGPMTDTPEDGKGLFEEVSRLRQLATAQAEVAAPRQGLALARLVLLVVQHRQGSLQVLGRLVKGAKLGLGGGEIGQRSYRAVVVAGILVGGDGFAVAVGG